MKTSVALLTLTMSTLGALGQGQLTFQNRVVGSVVAPIYGFDPANPWLALRGNTAMGTPAGSVNYGNCPLLAGTGWTAQLWSGSLGSTEAQLEVCGGGATTTFRTGSGAGFLVQPATSATVNGVPGGSGTRAAFQVRVWDNMGGTITGWAQIIANPSVSHGLSDVVQGNFDLGGGPTLPNPGLPGLTSFNLTVPEPSLLAWGAIGLGALLLRRRRRGASHQRP